jgi:FtsZ-binding cell division protein ZapB
VDASTARDMIEDLQLEIEQLREQLRQLEAERDQWQRRAVNND